MPAIFYLFKVHHAARQSYVAHDCDTSEMGSSRFAVADVHRIGILDLRLFNTDRHAGNILVRWPRASGANLGALARLDEAQLALVPIDHGFCLPEALEPPYLEWQHWPQARRPFPRILDGTCWLCVAYAGRCGLSYGSGRAQTLATALCGLKKLRCECRWVSLSRLMNGVAGHDPVRRGGAGLHRAPRPGG